MTTLTAIRTLPATRTGQLVADYASLTKPRIVELLLVTTVPAMLVAAGGWPGAGLVLAYAGWLAAALTVGAWLWYVGVYTLWLKRRSVQNIVIGGAGGRHR